MMLISGMYTCAILNGRGLLMEMHQLGYPWLHKGLELCPGGMCIRRFLCFKES